MRRGLKFRLVLLALAISMAAGAVLPVAQQVAAASCSGGILAFGRQKWCGYFYNQQQTWGDDVRNGGVPWYVNSAQDLITVVEDDLNSGNAWRITGAQFIIQTMRGRGPGAPKSVSGPELVDWENRIKAYANFGENGTVSSGKSGSITWSVWEHLPCGTVNTYYQPAFDDVAPFLDSSSNSNCARPWINDEFLLFRDTSGNVVYRIRRACMNPIGTIDGLPQPPPDQYNLNPSITTTVGGAPLVGGVEVGQTIRFSYSVRNSDRDPSPSASCTIYTNVHAGYFVARSNPPPGGGSGPPTSCPKVFAPNSTVTVGGPEDVLVNAANQTICRSLFVSPATATIASRGIEVCAPVINKPYLKVYGGDITAGNGQETSPGMCVSNPGAAIISWNRGPSASYAGASVQYAAMALSRIYEVSTASGNAPSSQAAPPKGLAFANNFGGGSVYGGSFGSLPCTKDYYAGKPTVTNSFTSLAASNVSGAYTWNSPGTLNLSGALPAGKRVTLYVTGNVFINSDISYPVNWSSGTSPLFQLVVKGGNIYIGNTVSRVDGVYIAQKDGAAGGTIYTCALGAAALAPDGNLFSRCNRKLTINGVFSANQVQFLRTNGTRQGAVANEAGGSGNIAEVFNFSPVMWMAQPTGANTGSAEYDSITSLPPIL